MNPSIVKNKSNFSSIIILLQVCIILSNQYYQCYVGCETVSKPNRESAVVNQNRKNANVAETIIINDSTDDKKDPDNFDNVTYCDRLSKAIYGNRSLYCVDYEHCTSIISETSEKVRNLTCGLKHDGSIRVCCSVTLKFSDVSVSQETPDEDTVIIETQSTPSPTSSSETVIVTDESLEKILSRRHNKSLNLTHKTQTSISKFPRECGIAAEHSKSQDEVRIIGGEVAKRNMWPWFALVMIQRRNTRKKSPECGGTLITDRFILTAAHCVLEQGKRPFRNYRLGIRFSEFDLAMANDGEIDVEVSRIIPHPNFQPKTFKNDIALIELSKKVNLSDSISPACLPFDDLELANQFPGAVDNQTAWVLGFGQTTYNGRTSDRLRQADLRIVQHGKCRKAFDHLVKLTREYVCASSQLDEEIESASRQVETKSGRKIKDSCQGDSGGPLLMQAPNSKNPRWYIYGIVSFGYRCASVGFPGVYTRVNRYLDWIESYL